MDRHFLVVWLRRGQHGGYFQHETGAVAGFAVDVNLAAVFAEDFLAYRQSQARAAALLRGDERAEEMVHLIGGNARPVVVDDDPRLGVFGGVLGAHHHPARRLLFRYGVDGVGHHVEHRAVDALGIEDQVGHGLGRLPVQLDLQFVGPDVHQLDHVGDRAVEVGRGQVGLAFLAEGEHVHHQGGDLVLVLLDDLPALAHDLLVVLASGPFRSGSCRRGCPAGCS